MNLQEQIKVLKEQISASEELISKLEEQVKKEQHFPQKYDDYWYVADDTEVLLMKCYNSEYDQGRLSIGNVFKTKEQAEFAVEKLKVEAELRKYSRPFESMEDNFSIVLDTSNGSLDIWCRLYSNCQGTIYFESEDKAQKAIETVGEERIKKYIFGVEE